MTLNINANGRKRIAYSFFTFLLFLIFSTSAIAQFSYKVNGIVKEDGQPLAGAIVSIFDFENEKVKEIVTPATGLWSFSLKPDEEYNIFITKQGYIKVKIIYSTIGISPSEVKKFKGTSSPEVELFQLPADPKLADKVTAILNQPYLSYYYSSDNNEIIGDEVHNQSMKEDVTKLQRLSDGPKAAAKDAAAIEAKYAEAIAKGDKALTAKNYPVAKEAYNEAIGIKSSMQYPKTKLAEIDKVIADAAAKEKADKEKANAAEAEKARLAKENADKEKAIAEAAEKLKAEKNKAAAEAAEKERLAKEKLAADAAEKDRIVKEKAAAEAAERDRVAKEKADKDAAEKERLTKEKALADEKAAKEKAEKEKALADAAAKEKAEKEKAAFEAAEKERLAKEKLAADAAERDRIAKEKADKDAAEKERLAKEKALADEKAAREKAEKEKAAAELAAKEKAEREKAEAEAAEKARLAKEKAEKEKAIADAAEKERLAKEEEKRLFEKRHKSYITKGDSAFSLKNFPVAQSAYNEALAMKPADEYSKNKLKEIDVQIANADLFKNELAKKYPLGVTEEKAKEGNMNITKRIVVVGNKGVLYTKKETSFGTVYYFKDGNPITEQEWNKETVIK